MALKHKSQLPLHPQKLNPDVSDDLARLILICMEKDKDRRYQTAESLLADLQNIEDGLPLGTKIQPRRKTFMSTLIQNKLFILAIVVASALIAVLIWKFLPDKEIVAVPKIENSIAVISFKNLTGDPKHDSFMQAVPSFFISKFETMGFSQVVTWEQLRNLLKQIGKDPDKPIDTETGFDVCRFAGIESLVVGKITKVGNVFATNITVLDAETQNSLASASSQGQGADSLIVSQIDDLVDKLAKKLDLRAFQKGSIQAMSELTTSSMEAYTYYLQGNDAYRMLYYDEAREHYQKAVEIDPTFAMAHLGVFHTYFQQNNNVAAEEALQKAIGHLDRVNPKEKLYIQAWYARSIEKDLQKMSQLFEEIIEKYPRELEAHYFLARRYENTDREEAEKKYLEMLDMDPHYTWALARLIELARRKQDYELGLEYAKRYISLNPNEPNPYCKLGEIYLDMGELDQSIEQYRRALAIKRGFRKALDWICYLYVLKEDYPEAKKWADEFILTSNAPMEKANGYLTKAIIEYWTGSLQRAQKNAEMAMIVGEDAQQPLVSFISFLLQGFIQRAESNISPSRNSFIEAEKMAIKAHPNGEMGYRANKEYFLGILDIQEGKLEQAQKRLITIRELSLEGSPEWTNRVKKRDEQALRSELLIAQGSYDEAISLLEPLPFYSITVLSLVSLSAGPWARANLIQLETRLAEAYEGKGDLDKAIDVLEKLIPFDHTDSIWRFTPPKIYYDLGRLYEKKGQKKKARENYTRFLELWKNADPGLPEVEDARNRLSEIKE